MKIPSFFLTAFYLFTTIPRIPLPSTHFSLNGLNARSGLPDALRFEDTATTREVPAQPPRMVLIQFSAILTYTDFHDSHKDGISTCLSTLTGVNATQIDLYNFERFAPAAVQVEYYALVTEEQSQTFSRDVDGYIGDGGLEECLRKANVGLGSQAKVLRGRAAVEPKADEIVSATGDIAGWIVGVVIGVVVLVGAIALVVVIVKGEKEYEEEEYESWDELVGMNGKVKMVEGESEEDEGEVRETRVEKELRWISGPPLEA